MKNKRIVLVALVGLLIASVTGVICYSGYQFLKLKYWDKAKTPEMVFAVEVYTTHTVHRIAVDPERPLEGLEQIAELIRRECREDARSSFENPTALCSIRLEANPSEGRTISVPDYNVTVSVKVERSPMILYQFGRSRFGWSLEKQLAIMRNEDATIGEATDWLGVYFTEMHDRHRGLVLLAQGVPLDEIEKKDKQWRESRDSRAKTLVEGLRRHRLPAPAAASAPVRVTPSPPPAR